MDINISRLKDYSIEWIQDWFEENGPTCNAIVGISGGKDSTVVAGLLVEALGKDRVIGVLMPNGVQSDIADSHEIVGFLGIKSIVINIEDSVNAIKNEMIKNGIEPSDQTIINLPPRIRMSTLYAVSQSMNGRVANTGNYSEDYVGYSTHYGDDVGDFAPLRFLTATQVVELGLELNLPEHLVKKIPSDGLSGKSDEDNLGFTYADLDKYIDMHLELGWEPDFDKTSCYMSESTYKAIQKKHEKNRFKRNIMIYGPNLIGR